MAALMTSASALPSSLALSSEGTSFLGSRSSVVPYEIRRLWADRVDRTTGHTGMPASSSCLASAVNSLVRSLLLGPASRALHGLAAYLKCPGCR